MLSHPLHEEILPNIHSKLPLVQYETVFLCLITWHLRKETDTLLAAMSFQVVAETDDGDWIYIKFSLSLKRHISQSVRCLMLDSKLYLNSLGICTQMFLSLVLSCRQQQE